MVGSNGTMIAIRLVRSKLRKREEHSNSVHPADVVLQTQPATNNNNSTAANNTANATAATVVGMQQQQQQQQQPPPVPVPPLGAAPPDQLAYHGQMLWTYTPPPPSQCLYNNDQDNLVQNLNNGERPGLVRGIRKNLGGRWRRLVRKKPPTEVYTIPAELKPQLKQIYVY